MTKGTAVTTQVLQIYIKATPQAVWDAITDPAWTVKYGYRSPSHYELRAGGKYRGMAGKDMLAMGAPAEMIDGEVIEADPPRKLVQTWRPLWDPALTAEGFTRVTWETEDVGSGVTKLTVTHELESAPKVAAMVAGSGRIDQGGGGWAWIISDLKTLLEAGNPM